MPNNGITTSPDKNFRSSLTPEMIADLKAAQEKYRPSAQAMEEANQRRRQYKRRKAAAARCEALPGYASNHRLARVGGLR